MKNRTIKLKVPGSRKLWLALSVLIAIALGGSWVAGVYLTSALIKKESLTEAAHAGRVLLSVLDDVEAILRNGKPIAEDSRNLQIAATTENIVHQRYFDAKGNVVFAFPGDTMGYVMLGTIMEDYLKAGKEYFKYFHRISPSGQQRLYAEAYLPLVRDGELIGAVEVYVDVTDREQGLGAMRLLYFGATQMLVVLLGGFMGVLVWWNDRLHRQANEEINRINEELEKRNQIIEQDIRLAAEFQRGVLSDLKDTEYMEVAFRFHPVSEVSGDMYDFSVNREREINLFVGDATGHGIAAAFLTMMAHTGLDGLKSYLSPAGVVATMNQMLTERQLEGMFLAGVFMRITPEGLLRVANAGHLPVIIVPGDGGAFTLLEKRGVPLGCFDNPKYDYPEESHQLQPGDKVVLVTDGVTEWHNGGGEQFGMERLLSALDAHRDRPVEEILGALVGDVESFSGGAPPRDDRTMVALKYLGASGKNVS